MQANVLKVTDRAMSDKWNVESSELLNKCLDAATAAGDGKKSCVLATMRPSRSKERMEPVCESVHEGVDMGATVHAEERCSSLLIVYIYGNPLWPLPQGQGSGRGCVGNVLIPISQTHSPETVGRADRELPLSVDRMSDYTHVPLGFAPHIYLPVVPAREKAFLGQDVGHAVKPPGAFKDILSLVTVPDLLLVFRQDEVGMGRLGVQSDIHWNSREINKFYPWTHGHDRWRSI